MKDEQVLTQGASNHEALFIKCRHLTSENYNLRQNLKDFQSQIASLRIINQEITKTAPQSIQVIINQLSKQNLNLQKALLRQIKINQQLTCDILMKNQLIAQNQNEYRQITSNYQTKIHELRVNLQTKQAYFSNAEDKILAERDQIYNLPNRANIGYFNQMNELKLLIQRHIVENAQLQLVTIKKNEQIEELQLKLKTCESVLKNKADWSEYKNRVQNVTEVEKTKPQQNNARIQIEQQLTRYDAKYKYITWHNNRRDNLSSQLYELKMFVSKLLRDKALRNQEFTKLRKELSKKEYELKAMREAQLMMQREVRLSMIQVEFYKNNFKELTKVPTQRKIKYYSLYYPQILPTLQKKRKQKSELIKYWKNWQQQYHKKQHKFDQKRQIKRKMRKVRKIRSNSCSIKLSATQRQKRKQMQSEQKQEAIFSFIGSEHEVNVNSVLGCTFESVDSPQRYEKELFQQQFSMIGKPNEPINQGDVSPFRKKHVDVDQILQN